jgi:hypothetical protein
VPDAGSTALIDGGQLRSGTVALYTSGAVGSFSLDAGYTLAVAQNSGVDLTVYGNATVNGTVDLGGWPPLYRQPTWNLRFSGSNDAQSISGTGTIKLGDPLQLLRRTSHPRTRPADPRQGRYARRPHQRLCQPRHASVRLRRDHQGWLHEHRHPPRDQRRELADLLQRLAQHRCHRARRRLAGIARLVPQRRPRHDYPWHEQHGGVDRHDGQRRLRLRAEPVHRLLAGDGRRDPRGNCHDFGRAPAPGRRRPALQQGRHARHGQQRRQPSPSRASAETSRSRTR